MVREIAIKKLEYKMRALSAKLVNMDNYNSRKHFNYDVTKFQKLVKDVETHQCYIDNGNLYG